MLRVLKLDTLGEDWCCSELMTALCWNSAFDESGC